MNNRNKILLAEDDKNLGYILSEYLKMNNFDVELCDSGAIALKQYNKYEYDICLFDVMMPEMDGFTLAKKIRENDDKIPIIFLTAKMLKIDKLIGFNIGADDYIVKPVDEEELIARIKAVLKRTKYQKSSTENTTQIYKIGNYIFDYTNQILTFKEKKQSLTTRETAILKALYEQKNTILDRKKTLKKLWGEQDYFTRKSIDVFIYKLRKYLSQDPNVEISNIHGKGFILKIKSTN